MTRLPFIALVAVLTAGAALVARSVAPGRAGVTAGVALGTGTAGAFAALALAVLRRIGARAKEDPALAPQAPARMARAFAGLMIARMLAYLAVVMAAVALKVVDPLGVGAGLVAGTLVFQAIEIVYLRKLT